MTNTSERIARLSPQKQELLLQRLTGKVAGVSLPQTGGDSGDPAQDVSDDQRYQPFPLTEIQLAYWVGRSGALQLGNVATHRYIEFETSDLDLKQFNLAWQRLIDRHDMLRAIILPSGQQKVLEQVPPYEIRVLDLRGEDHGKAQSELAAVRERLSHQVLASDRWPLFEICASRLDEERIRLHFSFDALILDMSSRLQLFKEWSQLYRDLTTPLPPLEISFREYVLKSAGLRDSDQFRRSQEYWRRRLPTFPPGPNLPLAKDPNQIGQHLFVRRSAGLKTKSWLQLKNRAAQADLTPSVVLLAAFSDILSVWCNNSRFTINLTLFNRFPFHPTVNSVIGDFTSLTLLEVDRAAQATFWERARQLQQQLWDDLDHRYVGGVEVMREMSAQAARRPEAVMPVVFTSGLGHNGDASESSSMSWLGDEVFGITQTPQVWLDSIVTELDGDLVLNWDAVEELFAPGLLDDMFDAYCRLLRELSDDSTLWQQPALETDRQLIPVAQQRLREEVNDTEAPISKQLLHTLFADQASRSARRSAVVATGKLLTYDDLQRQSNQVGHWLREHGARPNSLVAIVMEKGWEQVVAALGILNAGAAYLPIDPNLPQQRVAYLLEHGLVTLALVQSKFDGQLTWPDGITRLCVDQLDQEDLDDGPLEPAQKPTDLAYVIYTSGSTGLPKGVMIDHRGAVNTILDVNSRFHVSQDDRVFAISSLSFDLSVYDVFGTLAAGGAIVIPDAKATRDPGHWAELIRQEGVTIWNSVPALMEMLVEYQRGQPTGALNSLRLVMLSGDWIPLTLPDQIHSQTEDAEVVSLGGATEASIWSILYPINQVDPAWKSIPYGRPMVNQQFHVLNQQLEPCPNWVPGQLFIGGIGLAQGYWRDEEKTAASFITHPVTGEHLYRTGDLGRYLPSGDIEFLGREDFQVKIKGHRIELGEIESALLEHPGITNAVVNAVGERFENKRLVAYVVPEKAEQPQSKESIATENEQATFTQWKDPLERLRFKLAQKGVRSNNGHSSVRLSANAITDQQQDAYLARRSYREFAPDAVSLGVLSDLLSNLRQLRLPGAPFPKYLYGSAGGLYPVQVYLYVRPDRIEGVPAGTYYYHPQDHRLVLLSADAEVERSHYAGNESIFDQSAFALYLIGQLDAITPLYPDRAMDYCMLEAGMICQLLESAAPEYQLGLCQIGGFGFDQIEKWFDLDASHVYLNGLLGGGITEEQKQLSSLLDHFDKVRPFLELAESAPAPERSAGTRRQAAVAETSATPQWDVSRTASDQLQDFLKGKLPDYMVPSLYVELGELPLTANGKVDRKTLPEPNTVSPQQEMRFESPQTGIEKELARIWSVVLELEEIGLHDNFFDLGGTSFHVVRAIGQIRESLNHDISVMALFNHTTVSSLAEHLCQDTAGTDAVDQGRKRAKDRRAMRGRRKQARSAKKGHNDNNN